MYSASIIVPIHDPSRSEINRLCRLIKSMEKQTLQPSRIIFAASHNLDYVDNLTSKLQEKSEVSFQVNDSSNAPSNLNSLMNLVNTEYTKIMFQDDFFSEENSLSKTIQTLDKSGKNWIVTGCFHEQEIEVTKIRVIIPRYSRGLIRGVNSIGAPSVVALKSDSFLPFNENLLYMFDCEWYLSMKHKHGNPAIIQEPLIGIGIHENQATHWAKNELSNELSICGGLHKINLLTGKCRKCTIELNKNA